MHFRRMPHRFLSQVTVFALIASSVLPSATAGGKGEVPEIFAPIAPDTNGNQPLNPNPMAKPAASPEGNPQAQKTGVVPLCHPEKGFGASVLKFPEQSDAKYGEVVEAYLAERKKNIFDNLSKMHLHYSNPANENAPNLTKSMAARKAFFDLSFGSSSAVVIICEAKRAMTKSLNAYYLAVKQKASATGDTINVCAGAQKVMAEAYEKAESANNKLLEIINLRLNGGTIENKTVDGLEGAFYKNRQLNNLINNANKTKIATYSPANAKALAVEFEAHWGKGKVNNSGHNTNIDSNCFFSSMLLQTRKEKEIAENNAKALGAKKIEIAEAKQNCKNLLADAGIGSKPDEKEEKVKPTNTPRAEDDAPGEDTADGSRRPGARENNSDDFEEPTLPRDAKNEGGGMSGFLKDNWMWLAAGGAVVGGVVVYKKYKDNKRNNKWADDPSNYMPYSRNTASTNSSGSSSSVLITSNAAPAGSKLIILQAIGNVNQGQTLAKIDLVVVDANGMTVNVNGLAIEASCYTPQACSLTGGKSVTTVGGKVSFDSLVFNQAHTGVRLQFSAPGVPTVTTPNTFEVSATAANRN